MRKRSSWWLPWIVLSLIACQEAELDLPQIEDQPFITDDRGRVLILHGMNVMSSAKSDPERMPSIDAEQVRRMARDWGFNFVRFLIFWDAAEPSPGEYDEAYFDRVEERLDWFADEGMFVVLDMHQDVYAARFCCDGAPEWAIRDDGIDFELQPRWFLNYFEPAVQRAFDNFWDAEGEHADLQEHYADLWATVAERFGGHPAVLGYDLMNEPSPGSMNDSIELFGTENPDGPHPEFDRTRLQPFYQRMIDRIREVDEERWIFFEPRYGAPGNGLPSYLGVLEDPRPGPQRLVYFPHFYSLIMEGTESYRPAIDPSVEGFVGHRREEAAAQGAPILIGEWGFHPDWENSRQAYRDVLDAADRLLAGWAYWSYDPGGWGIWLPDGSEQWNADELIRPYARRVAGIPQALGFDADTRVFFVEFADANGTTGPTEIYVPAARHYPDGWTVWVSDPEGSWEQEWDAELEILTITTPVSDVLHRIEIRPDS